MGIKLLRIPGHGVGVERLAIQIPVFLPPFSREIRLGLVRVNKYSMSAVELGKMAGMV